MMTQAERIQAAAEAFAEEMDLELASQEEAELVTLLAQAGLTLEQARAYAKVVN
jgi:crotonobetainyl-CoA:carnitine CoA-transferase CaiB-like acyl-CoA transferase